MTTVRSILRVAAAAAAIGAWPATSGAALLDQPSVLCRSPLTQGVEAGAWSPSLVYRGEYGCASRPVEVGEGAGTVAIVVMGKTSNRAEEAAITATVTNPDKRAAVLERMRAVLGTWLNSTGEAWPATVERAFAAGQPISTPTSFGTVVLRNDPVGTTELWRLVVKSSGATNLASTANVSSAASRAATSSNAGSASAVAASSPSAAPTAPIQVPASSVGSAAPTGAVVTAPTRSAALPSAGSSTTAAAPAGAPRTAPTAAAAPALPSSAAAASPSAAATAGSPSATPAASSVVAPSLPAETSSATASTNSPAVAAASTAAAPTASNAVHGASTAVPAAAAAAPSATTSPSTTVAPGQVASVEPPAPPKPARVYKPTSPKEEAGFCRAVVSRLSGFPTVLLDGDRTPVQDEGVRSMLISGPERTTYLCVIYPDGRWRLVGKTSTESDFRKLAEGQR